MSLWDYIFYFEVYIVQDSWVQSRPFEKIYFGNLIKWSIFCLVFIIISTGLIVTENLYLIYVTI
jgi:hypothetical protein